MRPMPCWKSSIQPSRETLDLPAQGLFKNTGENKMSSYCGYSVERMLLSLFMYCEELKIQKRGDLWQIYALSDEFGELESNGSLLSVTMQAFKPFVEKAKKDQDNWEPSFNQINQTQGLES